MELAMGQTFAVEKSTGRLPSSVGKQCSLGPTWNGESRQLHGVGITLQEGGCGAQIWLWEPPYLGVSPTRQTWSPEQLLSLSGEPQTSTSRYASRDEHSWGFLTLTFLGINPSHPRPHSRSLLCDSSCLKRFPLSSN